MANQQFCLRWNNYQSNLLQVFDQLLQTESFVDVTLSCEGHSVKAHRMVLSACSPYFQALLSDAPCSHPAIILQGVKWPELKAVVEFMYKGEINICQEELGSLLRVAESLKIRGLAEVDGDGAEPAVLTSPSVSPAARPLANVFDDMLPSSLFAASRKRRRLSGDDLSRPCTPLTPPIGTELLEASLDLPGPLIRSNMNTPLSGSPATLTSLAARLPGAMPPPAPMPPHLPHLPPLSPLLNMHTMPRPHAPDDFEIRPGIAEMIREEERRRRDAPDMAKLLESSHHWMGTSMADGGGPVFPTMIADPPINTVAADTTAVSPAATTTTSNLPPKPDVPTLRTPSPISVVEDLDTTATWNTTKHTTTLVSSPSGHVTSDSHPKSTINHTSYSTAAAINASSVGQVSISGFTTKDSQVITIQTGSGKHMSRSVSPHTSTVARKNSVNSVGVITRTRGGGEVGGTKAEGAWDSWRGAISAPKSGASRWTQTDLMAALALVKAGTPIKPAAERCNIPVMTLWRRTRALGIVSSKVQCGFRYPAARRRSKNDHDSPRLKQEPDLHFPVKTDPESFAFLKVEPGIMRQSKSTVGDYLRYSDVEDVCVSRAGPLKEMSAVNASRRVTSRESSPRPYGRENSPLLTGRSDSPMALARKKNSYPENEDSSLTVLKASSTPCPPKERTPKPTLLKHNMRPLSGDLSCTVVKEENPCGPEGDVNPLPSSRAAPTLGRAERFRAWVDIVLEGAGGHQQQQDVPQDLSTRNQRPSTFRPPLPAAPAVSVTTTTPSQPSTSLVHH